MPKMRIIGEHAIVRELTNIEKKQCGFPKRKRIVERLTHNFSKEFGETGNTKAYSIGMALCQILYPKYFPRQLASGLKEHGNLTYSERVPLTKESQAAIKSYYWPVEPLHNKPFSQHQEKFFRKANRLANQILQESGINVNAQMMNVGVKKNRQLVFFEPSNIEFEKTMRFVQRMPDSLKKKQAMELLNALREHLFQGYVFIHRP